MIRFRSPGKEVKDPTCKTGTWGTQIRSLYGAAALRADAMTAVYLGMAAGNKLGVKALAFDVFGTVVDWRGSLVREGEEWGRAKGLQVDWGKFADRWREGYAPMMDKVRTGTLPWMKLDALHRMILDELLVEFQVNFRSGGLSEDEKEHLNHVWHRLKPWPDAVRGLERMKKNYVLATLSNGNVSLLVEMAKNAGLPWDAVLSAELFHHFKPDREVYLGAADLLGCKPAEVMMVAAHPGDLQAAQACGLRTAFVARPLENGPGKEASEESKSQVHNSTVNLGHTARGAVPGKSAKNGRSLVTEGGPPAAKNLLELRAQIRIIVWL